MIKLSAIIRELKKLIEKGSSGEMSYREAATCLQDEGEKALFIHLWQEHAKMVCELEDKVRWLGGALADKEGDPFGAPLHFRQNAAPEQILDALAQCERRDSGVLQDYDYVLQTSLPVDVKLLLALHVTKLKAMRSRVLELLVQRHHSAALMERRWARIGMKFQSRDPADGVRSQVVLKA